MSIMKDVHPPTQEATATLWRNGNTSRSENKDATPVRVWKVHPKKLKGVVVSNHMDKTVVVVVTRLTKYPKYQKYHKVSKKFKAHSEKNEYKIGDHVLIQETRPISKDKRWKIISKV